MFIYIDIHIELDIHIADFNIYIYTNTYNTNIPIG